jgi:hypothetical protein
LYVLGLASNISNTMSKILPSLSTSSVDYAAPPRQTIIDLPAELLQIIIDNVRRQPAHGFHWIHYGDLWSLYDASQKLRIHVIPSLFRETDIVFQRNLPIMLNLRRLPARTIYNIMLRHMSYIRKIYISQDCYTRDFFVFDLLGRIPKVDHCMYGEFL